MTERESLIELLQDLALSDEPCVDGLFEWADSIADHLLLNGVIVPPCEVGDKVWWVEMVCDENGKEKLDITTGEVVSFSLQKEGLWAYCRYESGLTYWHLVADCFDKTVFLIKEKAEKELAERNKQK